MLLGGRGRGRWRGGLLLVVLKDPVGCGVSTVKLEGVVCD